MSFRDFDIEIQDLNTFDPIWRSERVVAATSDIVLIGTGINPTTWVDNESNTDATNWIVGDNILSDVTGTPTLLKISNITSSTSIDLILADFPLADKNTFVVQSYLPDSPATQENLRIIFFHTTNSPAIKIDIRNRILNALDRELTIQYADFGTKDQRVVNLIYYSPSNPPIELHKTLLYTQVGNRYRRDNINWSIQNV